MKVKIEVQSDNLITHDDFIGVSRRVHYNQFISEFYERMGSENQMPIKLLEDGSVLYGPDENMHRRSERVKSCCRNWTFDFYKGVKLKNLVRVERCDDRFCLNCQSLISDQRQAQYTPVLDEYVQTHDLYHIVFTVPNVDEDRLESTIKLMFHVFGERLIRYFQGTKKIRGVDFEKYGYVGAVRAIEITVSKRDGTFHPHLHCIFALKKNLDLPKVFYNRYSVDRTGRQPIRLFSELEILLQRIWCLLILKIKVTRENIENIASLCKYPDGFTLTADVTNGDYHEVFKYAIKGSFKNETLFDYEKFLALYKALYGKQAYQTYGCFNKYNFNVIDEDLGLTTPDDAFDKFIETLCELEEPERIDEILAQALQNTLDEKCKYISRATFTRHFRALSEEDKIDKLKELQKIIDKKEAEGEQLAIFKKQSRGRENGND